MWSPASIKPKSSSVYSVFPTAEVGSQICFCEIICALNSVRHSVLISPLLFGCINLHESVDYACQPARATSNEVWY